VSTAARVPAATPHPPRPAWVPDALFPFRSRFVDLPAGRVHYVDEGRGPVLLMLHGNPTWSFLYRGLILRLARRFRCVALDYPGFGLSTAAAGYAFTPAEHAATVDAFVRALGLTGITLVVQDWGGPIGLAVAGRQPACFHALVIGNTWAWPVNGDRHFERFSRLMGGRLGGALIRRFNAFVNVVLPAGCARRKLDREAMAAYRGPFPTAESRTPMHVLPGEILRSRAFLMEVENGLSRLRDRPVLITWGERDFAFRARERERFEALFPRHRTVVLRGAGHYIQEDAPEEMAAAIEEWSRS